MKKKMLWVLLAAVTCALALTGCGKSDQDKADEVAEKIDAIYVQNWTEDTEKQCKEAKDAWDALTEDQKKLVKGENADPDYFGKDTGDASKDDPLNENKIGDKEILVVSFGTSFNDSRAKDVGGVEKAIQKAYPDWSVRRAFTAQIIINHVLARDDESIDNVNQALERAVRNEVKELVIQPTHLMHGAEYDELMDSVKEYKGKIKSIKVAEPLLGEVGKDASSVNADKAAVAQYIPAEAVKKSRLRKPGGCRGVRHGIRVHGSRDLSHRKDFLQPDAEADGGSWIFQRIYRNGRRRTGRYIRRSGNQKGEEGRIQEGHSPPVDGSSRRSR